MKDPYISQKNRKIPAVMIMCAAFVCTIFSGCGQEDTASATEVPDISEDRAEEVAKTDRELFEEYPLEMFDLNSTLSHGYDISEGGGAWPGFVRGATGTLVKEIRDFDRDGKEEMLTLSFAEDYPDTEGIYEEKATGIILSMYEIKDGEVVLSDTERSAMTELGNYNGQRYSCFLKETDSTIYIAENGSGNHFYTADGVNPKIKVSHYNGEKFVDRDVYERMSGSDFTELGDYLQPTQDSLRNLGFERTAENLDPYTLAFDREDGLEDVLFVYTKNTTVYNENILNSPYDFGDIIYYFSTEIPEDYYAYGDYETSQPDPEPLEPITHNSFTGEEAVYNEIMESCYDLFSGRLTIDSFEEPTYGLYYMSNLKDPLESNGYTLVDLNGDGTRELLIGPRDTGHDYDNGDLIFNGYTIKDGKAVFCIDGWERNTYNLGPDNLLYNRGSGGAMSTEYTRYRFDPDAEGYMIPLEVIYTAPDDEIMDVAFYHLTGNIQDTYPDVHDEDTRISQDEAWDILEGWEDTYMSGFLTPFGEY